MSTQQKLEQLGGQVVFDCGLDLQTRARLFIGISACVVVAIAAPVSMAVLVFVLMPDTSTSETIFLLLVGLILGGIGCFVAWFIRGVLRRAKLVIFADGRIFLREANVPDGATVNLRDVAGLKRKKVAVRCFTHRGLPYTAVLELLVLCGSQGAELLAIPMGRIDREAEIIRYIEAEVARNTG